MAAGDDGAWGAHWARLAVQAVLKAPVSPESAHAGQVLRLCCLEGGAAREDSRREVVGALQGALATCTDRDIQCVQRVAFTVERDC